MTSPANTRSAGATRTPGPRRDVAAVDRVGLVPVRRVPPARRPHRHRVRRGSLAASARWSCSQASASVVHLLASRRRRSRRAPPDRPGRQRGEVLGDRSTSGAGGSRCIIASWAMTRTSRHAADCRRPGRASGRVRQAAAPRPRAGGAAPCRASRRGRTTAAGSELPDLGYAPRTPRRGRSRTGGSTNQRIWSRLTNWPGQPPSANGRARQVHPAEERERRCRRRARPGTEARAARPASGTARGGRSGSPNRGLRAGSTLEE